MTSVTQDSSTSTFRSEQRIRTAASDNRLAWVDVAKGLGIMLVVYGHALRGFWGARQWPGWTVTQDSLIYAFHMPLFFIIGGLFLWKSIDRGRLLFVRSRWWAVIYPYLLWSIVCGGIEVAASRFANTPMRPGDLLLIPFAPIEQFWFLYALLIVQMVSAVCYPSKAALVLITILGIGGTIFSQGNAIFLVALRFLPFLAVGVCGAALLERLSASGGKLQMAAAAICWSVFLVISSLEVPEPWAKLVLGCLGSVGSLAAAMLLTKTSAACGLGTLGRASMAIYVLHTLFSAGTRAAIVTLGVDRYALWALIPEFAVGLLLPIPIWLWSRDHPRRHLLGFGDGPVERLREVQAKPIDRCQSVLKR